jgi:hypothetical protein
MKQTILALLIIFLIATPTSGQEFYYRGNGQKIYFDKSNQERTVQIAATYMHTQNLQCTLERGRNTGA